MVGSFGATDLAPLGARYVLTCILVVAGYSKLQSAVVFRATLQDLVPERLVRGVSTAIPTLELLLAGGLLVDRTSRLAASAAAVLLCVFSLILLRMLRAGQVSQCACFGEDADASTPGLGIARNVLLIASALVVVASAQRALLPRSAEELALAVVLSSQAVAAWVIGKAFLVHRTVLFRRFGAS
jgi:Methylamine utilisation protein MauE